MKTCLFVVLASACCCLTLAEETSTLASPENPCANKFKEDQNRITVSEACVNKTGLTADDILHSEEEFLKTYNDKCYGKCLLSELGMLKDLKFDREAIKEDIVKHVIDEAFQKNITAYTMECMDKAEKSVDSVTEDNVCKVSAMLLYCCKKEEMKLVC